MSLSSRTLRHCNGCGASKPMDDLRTCLGCRGTAYCGEDCQKKHWPEHKDRCKAVQLANRIGKELMKPEDRIVYENGRNVSRMVAKSMEHLPGQVQEDMVSLAKAAGSNKIINIHYDGTYNASKNLTEELIVNSIVLGIVKAHRNLGKDHSEEYKKMLSELDKSIAAGEISPYSKDVSVKVITVEEAKKTMSMVQTDASKLEDDNWWKAQCRILISTDLNKHGSYMHYIRIRLSPRC